MAARPWRGTLIYVGAVAVMTAAGVAKFNGVGAVDAAAAPAADGATSDESATTGPDSTDTGSTESGADQTGSGSSSDSTDPGSASTEGSSTSDDVTIVGSVAQTRYGNVQVSVTFAGEKITAVQALQIPDREPRDVQISQQAVPILTQEAIESGSARIDTVSGATYTSEGYIESLQSAIDQRG